MSTIISTRERANPLVLDTHVESSSNMFSGLADAIGEIGYCLKLSAQSLSFAFSSAPASENGSTSSSRLDSWPVDLWVF